MILGDGDKPKAQRNIELTLKITTFIVPMVELYYIWRMLYVVANVQQWIGLAVAAVGVLFFISGMTTMRDSWRAGIPEKKETELVTTGIYRYSRNPAFVGFDLMYIGLLLAFPGIVHAVVVLLVVVLFHLQILSEEAFLTKVFGEDYTNYKKSVRRYL